MMTEFHLGTRDRRFWNVIKYFPASSFAKHNFHASLKIDRIPSVQRGVRIPIKRHDHSLRDSCKLERTKSSIYSMYWFSYWVFDEVGQGKLRFPLRPPSLFGLYSLRITRLRGGRRGAAAPCYQNEIPCKSQPALVSAKSTIYNISIFSHRNSDFILS